MKGFAALLVCYLFVSLLANCARCNDVNPRRGYVFTAPKRLLAGETENGCVSLHNLEVPASILIELISPESAVEQEVLSTSNSVMTAGVEMCLELSIPATKYSEARLRLKMNFTKHPDYVVNAEKEVFIEHDSLITFVETDKPVYKPGQNVNIRILVLKHDLKPWKKVIPKVWIENPSEVRVAQWANVSTEMGLVQLQFPLSPEPSPGTWKIKLEKQRSPQFIHTSTFKVKKYVLPRFQLTISSPGYILADAENVTWNICAKYSYGKPVKGTLLLKSSPQTPSWRRKQTLPEIHYETELDAPDGCTEFKLTGAVLGLAHWKVAPTNIVLTANFTEAGTGVVETTYSRTVVVHQALKLEFMPYAPKYFKMGLPYHGKLRALYPDDSPAPNEKIQLCLRVQGKGEWLRVVVECRNFTTSTDGFVDFVVPPQHKNIVLLSFVATGIDYPTKYYSPDKRWRVFMDQPSAYIDVNPWYSPSESYLAVARSHQPITCGEKYSFNVMYTVPANKNGNESMSFHYSINSKGDLLIFGHVSHKPHRESVMSYSEFKNLLGATDNSAKKSEVTTVVHRFPLSVKVTPSMAPISELLLYYVRPDGETVATTYSIEVGNCFENKVKTAWHDDTQAPGSMAQLHIEAAPWSLCGISAVDKSIRFLDESKPNLVNTQQTFQQLKKYHADAETLPIQRSWSHCKKQEPANEEIDHLPMPAMEGPPMWDSRRKKRHVKMFSGATYVDAMQAFDDFGVVVISDMTIESRPCLQYMPLSGFAIDGMDVLKGKMINFREKALPVAFPLLNFSTEMEMNGDTDQFPDQLSTIRSYFPETWLWELIPTGKEGKATVERKLPDAITNWIGHTVCISPKHGLGIAPMTTLTAFQPFFLDYSLPYSVKRGELLHLKASLFNYMQHSLPVKIKLENATGMDLHSKENSASFCVKPGDSVVNEFLLKPKIIGEINITVSAAIDSSYPESCGPSTIIFTRDVIVKPILVQAEGFPVEKTKSAFICPKDFSDDSAITWTLDLPKDLVPDSARGSVSLVGDILGPALENLNNLVRLPMGCGEQNMVLFVPNIHVIGYLDATNRQNPDLRAKAIRNMEKGYQRELNYRHSDGSYSAFGPEDSNSGGSIWLTAFVVKSLAQARSLIHIDERDLKLSVRWIVKKQLDNGCFPVIGRIFHKDMKGGLLEDDSSTPALTAYILVSLFESGVPLPATLTNSALYCLEKGMSTNDTNLYTITLSNYALTLLEHPKAAASMKKLMTLATRSNDLVWWEDKKKPSLGVSIEMTAYAVLSLVKLGGEENMVEALKAIRWMSKQRNVDGGFTSTQDTILGLEALTKYAMAMTAQTTDLSILVTAGQVDQVYRLHEDNQMILKQVSLPVLPTVVEIFAEGSGCVLVQSNLKYNVMSATGSQAFDLTVSAKSIPSADECNMQEISICARYLLADQESNMALLEIGMISGFFPDRSSLHSLLEDSSKMVKRFEENKDVVTLYFDKLTGQTNCVSLIVIRENIVDRTEPANVKLYDYYQKEFEVSTKYSFPVTCTSADIIEENPEVPQAIPIEPKVVQSIEGDENNEPVELNEKQSDETAKTTMGQEKQEKMISEKSGKDGKLNELAQKLHEILSWKLSRRREDPNGIPVNRNVNITSTTTRAASTTQTQETIGTTHDATVITEATSTESFIAFEKDTTTVEITSTTNFDKTTTQASSTTVTSTVDSVTETEAKNITGAFETTNLDGNADTFKSNLIANSVPLEIDIGSGEGAEELDIGSNSSSVMIIDFSDGLNKKHEPEIIDDRDLEIANGILKPIDNMNNENNGLNPSFVLVDHELEVPDGIEGPKEVYVTPDNPSFYQNVSFDLSVNRELEATYTTPKFIQRSEDETFDEPQRVIPLQSPSPALIENNYLRPYHNASCPICEERLPINISEIFCSSKNAVKLAVRRLRRGRLLLDLKSKDQRLRSTLEFRLDSNCQCTPIDNPGSVALLIDSGDVEIATLADKSTYDLDSKTSVFNLPNVGGAPPQLSQAMQKYYEYGSC